MKQKFLAAISTSLIIFAAGSSCKKLNTDDPQPGGGTDSIMVSTLSTGYQSVIAAGKHNVYALKSDTIYKINQSGVKAIFYTPPVLDTSRSTLNALATDAAGNVYTIVKHNTSATKVIKIDTSGTPVVYVTDTISFAYKMAIGKSGDIYFSNTKGIQKLTTSGVHTTLAAGSFTFTLDSAQNLVYSVVDGAAHTVRIEKRTPGGIVSTLAGPEHFGNVTDIAADKAGRIYISDMSEPDNKIHIITNTGLHTLISTPIGHVDGPLSVAKILEPYSLAISLNALYFAETNTLGSYIRKVTFNE